MLNLHMYNLMSMYNLMEYSSNYFDTTGILWFYPKDETDNFNTNIVNGSELKSFKFKTKLLGKVVAQATPKDVNGILGNATIAVSLKYLSNFWRSLEMSFVNYKTELKLKWTKHCVVSVLSNENDNTYSNSNNIMFTIKVAKLYVPVATLSAMDN